MLKLVKIGALELFTYLELEWACLCAARVCQQIKPIKKTRHKCMR